MDIKKKELQEISMEKQNITIKKIHGELYYYAQQRKDGKVKSRYLSPVIPGKIADIENILYESYIRPRRSDLSSKKQSTICFLAIFVKKAASVMLASAMVVSLAACGSSGNKSGGSSDSDTLRLVVSDLQQEMQQSTEQL